MCDTIVALPSVTKEGVTLFGKNSDRESDEVQNMLIVPRRSHNPNEKVKCTYLEIPQVAETNRIFICQPFWMWGAEMGVNEYGVAIGNEALLTRVKPAETGLTGMDLLRLALERTKSAKEAREIIITLLGQYGQGGNCGYRSKTFYQNGFLIADKEQAFVLEAIGSNWAWKEIHNYWSISNKISLERDYDAISPGLIDYAIAQKWCTSEADFNFSQQYSDKIITWGGAGKNREYTNRCHLQNKMKSLTELDFMAFLRYHEDDPKWIPSRGLRMTVCAHAANTLTRNTQTTASIVGKIASTTSMWFATAASNPCLSPYLPIFAPNTTLPTGYLPGGVEYHAKHYWWLAEKFHRMSIMRYLPMKDYITPQITKYEQKYLAELKEMKTQGQIPDQNFIDTQYTKAMNMLIDWIRYAETLPSKSGNPLYQRYWNKYNELNHVS